MTNDRQRAGPLDDHQIQGMIAAGRIEPQTMMWRAGFASWVPASTVPELWANAGSYRLPSTTPRGSGAISPPLWNPNAAVNWSLAFSVGFGAWLHAKNWAALKEPENASKSMIWAYVGFAALLAWIVSLLLQPPMPTLLSMSPSVVYLGVLLSWYFIAARQQVRYIQTQFGDKYARQQWVKPISVGAAFWVALLILNLIASGIKPTPSPRRTTTRARAPDPEVASEPNPSPESLNVPTAAPTPAPESTSRPPLPPAPESMPEPMPEPKPEPTPDPWPPNMPRPRPRTPTAPMVALNQQSTALFYHLISDIQRSDVLKFPEYVACKEEVVALKSLVGLLEVAKDGKLTFAFDLSNFAVSAKRELDTRQKFKDGPIRFTPRPPEVDFKEKMGALATWKHTQLSQAQDRVLKFQRPEICTYPALPRPFAQTQISDMESLSKSIQDSLKKSSDLTSQDRIDALLTIMHFCLRLSVSQRLDGEQRKAVESQSTDLDGIKQVLSAVVAKGPSDDIGAAQNALNFISPLLQSSPVSNEGLIGQGTYWSKYWMNRSDTQKFLRSSYWPTLGLKAHDISCNDLFEALIGAVCPTAVQGDSLKQTLADFRQSMGWR